MITVRIATDGRDGSRSHVRVTAKDIATAVRLTGGRVIFPIKPEEFFSGSGPESFASWDFWGPESAK